jgi:hypothetical protein
MAYETVAYHRHARQESSPVDLLRLLRTFDSALEIVEHVEEVGQDFAPVGFDLLVLVSPNAGLDVLELLKRFAMLAAHGTDHGFMFPELFLEMRHDRPLAGLFVTRVIVAVVIAF